MIPPDLGIRRAGCGIRDGRSSFHLYGSSEAMVTASMGSGRGVDVVGVSVDSALGVDDVPVADAGAGVDGAAVGVRAAALCMNLRFSVDEESPPAIFPNASVLRTNKESINAELSQDLPVSDRPTDRLDG